MFKDILKYSLRSFKRQRSYVAINITGLSVGIACSLFMALYVIKEAGYDGYNIKKDRLVRLVFTSRAAGQEVVSPLTSPVIGPAMLREFPEVEDFMRMNSIGTVILEYNKKQFTEDHIIQADSSFFRFFSIPVLAGDADNLLNEPWEIVISESTAKRIFGNEDPLNKIVKIGNDTVGYTVSGVMADVPENSHFEADFICSLMTNPKSRETIWLDNSFSTYLLLKPGTNSGALNEKMDELVLKYVGPEFKAVGVSFEDFIASGNVYSLRLQNLTDIHLDPSVHYQLKEAIDPKYLRIFGSIAVLIIFIAAINFVNLATAQSSRRAKEVAIKKIGGSSGRLLIAQFLSESFILAIISCLIAIITLKLTLPYFNGLLGTNLKLQIFREWYIIPLLVLFALVAGFLAGSYPAFNLSSFTPLKAIKGDTGNRSQNVFIRKILVIFQFTISIFLIIATIIMYNQINYMLKKDVGFKTEKMIVIQKPGFQKSGLDSFKSLLKEIPGVMEVAGSTSVPGRNNAVNAYQVEGRKDEIILLTTNWIDMDFLQLYGIPVISGRTFSQSYSTEVNSCIINEAAVKKVSFADPEKRRFMVPREDGKTDYFNVIGVVKDFHFEPLRKPVEPYMFRVSWENNYWGYFTIKLSSPGTRKIISDIETVWKENVPDKPFIFYFIDEDFRNMYRQEQQNARIAVVFSIIAVFIAILGLFGLTSFTVAQRTKEIGVRKAMGSSVPEIYFTIIRDVVAPIIIAALISCPLAYYVAGKWLQNFYYRINPGILTFAAGFTLAFCIALLVTSYQVLKAARVNPVESLKYE